MPTTRSFSSSADVGYEDNHYPFSSYRGSIYGLGIQWRPTERTNVVANWEHRFFGASYLFTFDHRTPLSVWSINASRNITSYPQQLASLPAGNVQGILNQLFTSRIPDPTQRQDAIDALIQNQGLPAEPAEPGQPVYAADHPRGTCERIGRPARSPQFHIPDRVLSAPGAHCGLRNAAAAHPGRRYVQQQYAKGRQHRLDAQPDAFGDVKPDSHRVLQTVANPPFAARTNQGNVSLTVTSPLTARMSVSAGARYQVFRPNFAQGYNEAADLCRIELHIQVTAPCMNPSTG